MLTDKLLININFEEKSREWANPLRLSSAGKCARALTYQLHNFEARPLSARARMVFRLGDTIEAEIKKLLIKYPPEGIELIMPEEQEVVSITIGETEIKGHIDGRTKNYLIEIKSINGLGFKRILKGDIGYSYECQATAYMKGLGLQHTLFIFYNKDTSHIAEVKYNFDDKIWNEVIARFTSVIQSTKEKLPEREYQPLKTGNLPWQCSYCAYVNHCWPEHKVTFDDNDKPQLIVAQTKGKI